MSITIENVTKWVKTALGTDKCSVEIEGSNALGEGYLSDLSFVRVVLTEEEEDLHLVVKVCKDDPKMKRMAKLYFEREILFYEEMVPLLLNFQKDKKVREPFTALPKCYKAFTDGDVDVIVMENVKTKGFVTVSANLDIKYFKLILKNYAKFHALSFALNDQKKDIFEEFDKRCHNFFPEVVTDFKSAYEKAETKVTKDLNEAGRPDLAEKFEKLVKKGVIKMLVDTYNDVPKERVIGHGDCHVGNMFFKYKDEDTANPQEIILVDFQAAKIHSPIIDLAGIFYLSISKEGLTHFKELMEFYHQELTSFLAELGTDVNEVFSQSVMWEHWAKYKIIIFVMTYTFLELRYTDISNLAEALDNDINAKFDDQNRAQYLDSLVAVADFHLNSDIYINGNVSTR